MDDNEITLASHERASQERHGETIEKLQKLTKEAKKMSEHTPDVNVYGGGGLGAGIWPMLMGGGGFGGGGAALGGGIGGGLLGGILGGALLNRGGLLGSGTGNVEGVVTPSLLASSLADVTSSLQNTNVLQTLGDIKASVPLAEGQVQLALAGVQAELSTQNAMNAAAAAAGIAGVNQNASINTAQIIAGQTAIKDAVTQFGVANLTATKDSQYATQTAIAASTKEIIAALNDQNVANLQRQLTVAESQLAETRSAARVREVEVNVTQSTTQNQSQIQLQTQQQQQFQILAQLAANVNNLANDMQVVRQGQTIFNSGNMAASGTQTDANTRVN